MTNCVNESKKYKLLGYFEAKEWVCAIFAYINYGSFAAHVEAADLRLERVEVSSIRS